MEEKWLMIVLNKSIHIFLPSCEALWVTVVSVFLLSLPHKVVVRITSAKENRLHHPGWMKKKKKVGQREVFKVDILCVDSPVCQCCYFPCVSESGLEA